MMTAGVGQSAWNVNCGTTTGGSAGRSGAASSSQALATDVAELSDAAKAFSIAAPAKVSGSGFNAGASTRGRMAGVGNNGLKKYLSLNDENGDTGLAAMNLNRKSIGAKIDSLIRAAGVKLGKDEKITISVDADNVVRVGGLRDSDKVKAIEEALNRDKKLAKDIKSHVANGKITDAAKKQEAYAKQMGELGVDVEGMGDLDDMFTNRGIRTYVIDQYLQDNAGLSLADLQYEKLADDTISLIGVPEELKRLFDDDPQLAATVSNMLENGETKSDFRVSLEFANGAISDDASDQAARDKIAGIKAKMMGTVDGNGNKVPGEIDIMRERLEAQGVDPDDPEYKKLMQMLSRGFSIQVGRNGEYEILGTDGVSDRMVDLLKTVVERSISKWADDPSGFDTEPRSRTLADVADAFLEQHRFEHGDVDEHEHMVEINWGGGPSDIKVVSPAADREQDAKNQETADALGKQLKGVLEKEGIALDFPLEVEIDEQGRIKVLGDPDDPTIQKAQQAIDKFLAGAKDVDGEKKKSEEEKAEKEAAEKRREVRGGTSIYEEQNRNRFAREAMDKLASHLPDGPDEKTAANAKATATYMGWLAAVPKYAGGTHFGSNVAKTTSIDRPRFGGSSPTVNPGTLAMDDGNYGDNAVGLYRKLVDGMGQFHDARKGVSYRFTIA